MFFSRLDWGYVFESGPPRLYIMNVIYHVDIDLNDLADIMLVRFLTMKLFLLQAFPSVLLEGSQYVQHTCKEWGVRIRFFESEVST